MRARKGFTRKLPKLLSSPRELGTLKVADPFHDSIQTSVNDLILVVLVAIGQGARPATKNKYLYAPDLTHRGNGHVVNGL